MAKLLGGCLSLWIPLALAFVLALLIVLANPDVALNTEAWLRLGLFFALSCLFLGQIFALSLMVSAFVRHSSTALIICLFGWLSGGVVYLNALPSLTQYGIKEQPYPVFEQRRAEVFENYAKEMAQWEEKHPGPEEVYLRGIEDQQRLRYAHPRGYAWLQQRNAVRIKKEIERARTIHKYHWENQKTLARESLMVDEWSIFSPFSTYQVLSYQLARTTLDDKFYLTKAGRRYRETYIQYLRGKNAFGSRRWFTDDPEDQEPMIPRHWFSDT